MTTRKSSQWRYIVAAILFALGIYWWISTNNEAKKGMGQESAEVDPNSADSFVDANGKQKNSEQLSKERSRFHIPAEDLTPVPVEKIVLPAPVEPPNPATNPPEPLNPGGVNGQRPPRK